MNEKAGVSPGLEFQRDAASIARMGNAAGRRAVARGVSQQHRRFIARHQALVGVRRWIGKGVAGLGMLDHAANEEQAEFRQISILIACHHRLSLFPDGEVAMHARAVVADHTSSLIWQVSLTAP